MPQLWPSWRSLQNESAWATNQGNAGVASLATFFLGAGLVMPSSVLSLHRHRRRQKIAASVAGDTPTVLAASAARSCSNVSTGSVLPEPSAGALSELLLRALFLVSSEHGGMA